MSEHEEAVWEDYKTTPPTLIHTGECVTDDEPWPCDTAEQDRRDGAALRRLREALPEGWVAIAGFGYTEPGTPEFEVDAWPHGRQAEQDWAIGHGATVAEAADKCREALEGETG